MPDALPAATLPICPGLGQAQEYAGLHTPVAYFGSWQSVTAISVKWMTMYYRVQYFFLQDLVDQEQTRYSSRGDVRGWHPCFELLSVI